MATLPSGPDEDLPKLAALGSLTADIVHDLGNSVFALLGHVDLLLADIEGPTARERLAFVREAALRLRDDVQVFGELLRGETAALDDVVRAAVQLLRHGRGKQLAIVERYPEAPVHVACDPKELRSRVLVLLVSARNASSERGRLEIALESDGTLRVRADGEELVLRLPLAR